VGHRFARRLHRGIESSRLVLKPGWCFSGTYFITGNISCHKFFIESNSVHVFVQQTASAPTRSPSRCPRPQSVHGRCNGRGHPVDPSALFKYMYRAIKQVFKRHWKKPRWGARAGPIDIYSFLSMSKCHRCNGRTEPVFTQDENGGRTADRRFCMYRKYVNDSSRL